MIQLFKLLLLLAHIEYSLIVSFVAVLLAAGLNQSIDLGLNHFRHTYEVLTLIENLCTCQSHSPLCVKDGLAPARNASMLILGL